MADFTGSPESIEDAIDEVVARVQSIVAGANGGISREDADASYVPVPASAGVVGQVLAKTSTGTAWIAPPSGGSGGSGGVFTDTDGVPYFDTAASGGSSLALDTDGVPYFV